VTSGQPDFAYFESRIDQSFAMRLGPDSSTPLRLVSCVRRDLDGGPSSFTLEFSGGPDAPPEQGTYLLTAEGTEEIAIFLVPLRQTPTGVDYLAVFNQLDQG
jgi:hypothetical protein